MPQTYDAIVVGARCAGSPTAMLLARKGYRVLVVDRATFPSDTVSTHVVQPLARRRARALGTARSPDGDRLPADSHLHVRLRSLHDLGSAGHEGRAGRVLPAADRSGQAARRRRGRGRRGDPRRLHRRGGPDRRRTRRRHQGPFEGRQRRSPSAPGSSSARMAGTRSWPQAVRPEQYNEKPPLLAAYYTYWSGLPMDGRFETYIRPNRGFAAAPTHDGLTLTVGGWPYAEFEANKKDVEGNFLKMFDLVARVRGT